MKLFDYGNEYIRQSDWKDLALIKLCLCAMGLIIGVSLPKKARKPAVLVAMLIFIATYIPLILKFFTVAEGYSQDIEI